MTKRKTTTKKRKSGPLKESSADDRAEAERLEWLSRPRLHPAIFDDILRDERLAEAIANFGLAATLDAVSKSIERPAQIDGIAMRLGWDDERRASLMNAVAAYRREPSIEHYLRVRREFPEVEIQVALFGFDLFFGDWFEKQGIELHLIAKAMDGNEPSIDALSLRLLQLLMEREKLPKSGPGHIEKRRGAVTDKAVNYLSVVMLESCDWNRHSIPGSLVVLIRQQLCGVKPDLHAEYLVTEKRQRIALQIGSQLKPGEQITINKAVAMTGLPRATVARWLTRDDFKKWMEYGRQWAADGYLNEARRRGPHG